MCKGFVNIGLNEVVKSAVSAMGGRWRAYSFSTAHEGPTTRTRPQSRFRTEVQKEGTLTQADAILNHLQAGNTITPLDAYMLYGCLALHSRVAELRERKYNIKCKLISVGGHKRVGQYRLISSGA